MASNRVALFLLLSVALVFGLLFARQVYLSKGLSRPQFENKKLRILTYSTFVSSSGPGPDLIQKFKQQCNCDIEVITAGDAWLMLQRLKLADAGVPIDLVIGLDQLMLQEASEISKWIPLEMPTDEKYIADIKNFLRTEFIPFDWSPLTFVYKKSTQPVPKNFSELLASEYKKQFALQDPKASSPGLQFVYWVKASMGERTQNFLQNFKANVHSVSPSWAFSYGLFKKEQTRFVFSYVTSLAFHWGVEKQMDYQVLNFPEGHPVQVEYAAIPATCRECELGKDFLSLMLSKDGQKTIMEKNFMFPVVAGVTEGTIFSDLPKLKIISNNVSNKDLSDWDKVF